MSNSISISIIVPVYNVASYLCKCIDSILNQTFCNFELILINDGSSDDSGIICNEYAKQDERVFVIHQQNRGQSAARNIGINIAKGEYLSFIDADDFVAPTFIETLYKLLITYNADIAECGYYSVYKDYSKERCVFGNGLEFGKETFLIEKYLNEDIFYGVVTKLFKAELFLNNTFPEGRIYEDSLITLRFCLEPLKYVRTEACLYYYVQNINSTLRSPLNVYKAREHIHLLENQLDTIQKANIQRFYKEKLFIRIKEKCVIWYLGLALSDQKIIRRIYSKIYVQKLDFSMIECLRSPRITLIIKLKFFLCRFNLSWIIRYAHVLRTLFK